MFCMYFSAPFGSIYCVLLPGCLNTCMWTLSLVGSISGFCHQASFRGFWWSCCHSTWFPVGYQHGHEKSSWPYSSRWSLTIRSASRYCSRHSSQGAHIGVMQCSDACLSRHWCGWSESCASPALPRCCSSTEVPGSPITDFYDFSLPAVCSNGELFVAVARVCKDGGTLRTGLHTWLHPFFAWYFRTPVNVKMFRRFL